MTIKEGDMVTYIDDLKKEHNALVNAVHGILGDENPSINIVYVSDDTDKRDIYGRELKRETSVVHIKDQSAHVNCWLRKF